MKYTEKPETCTVVQVFTIVYFFIALWQSFPLAAQVSLGGHPLSWSLPPEAVTSAPEATPPIDTTRPGDANGADMLTPLLQIAYNAYVNWGMDRGEWIDLIGIGRLWRVEIRSEGAKHLSIRFDGLFLPKGSLLYVYNQDRSETIGAFSYHNNHPQGQLATAALSGDRITIEYFEPLNALGEGRFRIGRVSHGFVPINQVYEKTLTDCQVGANCSPEGDNWQRAKKSIAMMVLNGAFVCTGTLMNNTFEDFTPYVLTARHCLVPGNYDAEIQPNASDIVFYWNYNALGCNASVSLSGSTTSGAVVVANSSETGVAGSDFALLRLNENPADFYDVYFAGYETSAVPAPTGISLHHPGGQPLKIATYQATPSSYLGNRFWRVYFAATPNGHSITEGGSSGASLFDANERVIGQLYGGSSVNCNDPTNDWAVYGKLAYSWNNNGNTDPRRRLSSWLDPQGNGLNASFDGKSAEERPANCTQLFFSEYAEGYAFQRCIEIYNPTEKTIDLAEGAYSLAFYFEGSTTAGTTIPLTGSIEPKGVYVVCDNDAGLQLTTLSDQIAFSIFFNGDDAVALYRSNKLLDVIGQIGADPGMEWGSGYASTANNTIRRKANIQQGDKNPGDVFNPADEWIGFPIGHFSDLGSHDCLCNLNTCVPGLLNHHSCDAPDVRLNIPPGDQFLGAGVMDTIFSPASAGPGIHSLVYIHNNDTCRISMTVVDTLGPKIYCRDFTITAIPENGYVLQADELIDYAQSADNCSDWEISSFSPEMILPGQEGGLVNINVMATDATGHTGQCTAKINLGMDYIRYHDDGYTVQADVYLFPNPSSGIIQVRNTKAIRQIEIYDITGFLKFHDGNIEAGITPLNLSKLANGCYFAKFKFEDESIREVKLVISRG